MIEDLIKKNVRDANYRISKIQNLQTNEEDILLLLESLSKIIESITELKNNLSKKLNKYLVKN